MDVKAFNEFDDTCNTNMEGGHFRVRAGAFVGRVPVRIPGENGLKLVV